MKKLKKLFTTLSITMAVAILPILALADGTGAATVDYTTPMTTGLQSCVTSTIAMFSAIIPIGLTIFAAKFCWVKGVAFFSKMASK